MAHFVEPLEQSHARLTKRREPVEECRTQKRSYANEHGNRCSHKKKDRNDNDGFGSWLH